MQRGAFEQPAKSGTEKKLLLSHMFRVHFEFVVDSELFGVTKPDPEIFLEGCRRMGLPPEECLYVGDLYPVDYLGATRAGLQAVLFDPWDFHVGEAPRIRSLGELPSLLANGGG